MLELTVKPIPGKGRGVIAERDFAAGEVVEVAPVVLVPDADAAGVHGTIVARYWYEWDEGDYALVMGYGSLYNHSFDPNAEYVRDFEGLTMSYVALRPIRAGEEVTINYNGVRGCDDPVGFEVR
jgi:hypothetical protein